MKNIEEINEKLKELSDRKNEASINKDYELMEKIISEVLELVPNHGLALKEMADVKKRLKKYDEAYKIIDKAISNYDGDKIEVYNSKMEICEEMNKIEESSYYSKLLIKLKKKEANETQKVFKIPSENPVENNLKNSFGKGYDNEGNNRKSVISYSLYGNSPKYCEVAILNVKLAKSIYPEWKCRFYVDKTVPEEVISRLKQENAEIIFVNQEQREIPGTFWRFLVIDDESVDKFMIRDADSLLSYKEKAAVKEWLNSGKYFHVMRDSRMHNELILAGMWGGYNGVIKNMFGLMKDYLKEDMDVNRISDQVFLRKRIWKTVIQSVLVHDSYHLGKEGKPYPDYEISDIEKIAFFHIGMIDSNSCTIKTEIEIKVKKVKWYLENENGEIICSYDSFIKKENGKQIIEINLPTFYSSKIKFNKWKISYEVLE